MNRLVFLVAFLFVGTTTFGQSIITIDKMVDTSNAEVKKVVALWINYLKSRPDSLCNNPYWNTKEKIENRHFDFLESEFQPSLYMGFPVAVVEVRNIHGLYQVKSVFASCESEGIPNILCITNVFAKKENGEYKLFNALPVNRDREWNHKKAGHIDYYFPYYHKFDSVKAKKLNSFIITLCKNFDIPFKQVEYYFADDFMEVQRLRGFDYEMGMSGNLKPTGRSDENRVYCGGLAEYYPHEIVHVFINPYYPNCHNWILEGLATFLGGSRGYTLLWHIKNANRFLKKHPEIDLNNVLNLDTIDDYTDYRYVVGGLVCKLIYEKGGWELLKMFLKTGKSNEDYYSAIESFLDVKQKGLNDFLRWQLNIESEKVEN